MEDESNNIENTEETQGTEQETVQNDTVEQGGENENVEVNNPAQEEQPTVTEPKEQENNEQADRKFTQADIDKAVKSALAKKLPPKKEMDEFKAWKDAQKTEQEKAQEREKHYLQVEKENETLKHENLIIKSGVRAEDVDYVLFKVEKMDGDDFEDNLKAFLSASNDKYTAPKTKTVEGLKHETKQKETITKADLEKMTFKEKLDFYEKNPEAYEKAMRG